MQIIIIITIIFTNNVVLRCLLAHALCRSGKILIFLKKQYVHGQCLNLICWLSINNYSCIAL